MLVSVKTLYSSFPNSSVNKLIVKLPKLTKFRTAQGISLDGYVPSPAVTSPGVCYPARLCYVPVHSATLWEAANDCLELDIGRRLGLPYPCWALWWLTSVRS